MIWRASVVFIFNKHSIIFLFILRGYQQSKTKDHCDTIDLQYNYKLNRLTDGSPDGVDCFFSICTADSLSEPEDGIGDYTNISHDATITLNTVLARTSSRFSFLFTPL